MAIAINGSGTVTGISVGGLPDGIVDEDMLAATSVSPLKRKGSGTVLQIVENHSNEALASNATSYVVTPVTAAITPLKTNSTILIEAAVGTWPPPAIYLQLQLRASGGATNNDLGVQAQTYATVNDSAFHCSYRWSHVNHGGSSAITYAVWGKKTNANNANNFYFPNNNTAGGSITWSMTLTEILA